MTNYQIGDFLIRIKNAVSSRKRKVVMPKTKYILEVARCVERMGYLKGVKEVENLISVDVVYRGKEPLLTDLNLISKPGLRIYREAQTLKEYRGPATYVISTSLGVLTLSEAIKKNVGGEIVAEII